jgi:hypothetical protein
MVPVRSRASDQMRLKSSANALPPLAVYKHMLAEIYHLRETDEIAQPNPREP